MLYYFIIKFISSVIKLEFRKYDVTDLIGFNWVISFIFNFALFPLVNNFFAERCPWPVSIRNLQ